MAATFKYANSSNTAVNVTVTDTPYTGTSAITAREYVIPVGTHYVPNSSRYWNEWDIPNQTIEEFESLAEKKAIKKADFRDNASRDIAGDFTSDALGASNTYKFGVFDALSLRDYIDENATRKVRVNNVLTDHTNGQLIELRNDYRAHRNTVVNKLAIKENEITNAADQAALDAITW